MLKLVGIAIAAVVLAIMARPFLQDAYSRYQVRQQLDKVMDSRERAEFERWNGDAASFARTLYERCLSRGGTAVQCDRYRAAYE